MLRDTAQFTAWVERTAPSYVAGKAVEEWIAGLATASWQAPSVPGEADGLPAGIRTARLIGAGFDVVVTYFVESTDTGDAVDLLWVGTYGEPWR